MPGRKIPATILTGFLGAGKTSLIRHLLATAHGRRLALIINEFGDLGVDREVLTGCGVSECREDDIVELTNGCLCCTVADDFLPTLRRLVDRPQPPDHIIIETSGLALPKPLVKAFTWPEIRTRVTVDGVIAVIDAPAVAAGRFAPVPAPTSPASTSLASTPPTPETGAEIDHESPLEEVFEEQIQCADLVVVNKIDLVDQGELEEALKTVQALLRPAVKIMTTSRGAAAADVILGLRAQAEEDLDSRPSHHDSMGGAHDHDDFESFVVPMVKIADPAAVEARLRATIEKHDILRVKGFLEVEGKPLRHVLQGVGARIERYYDRPWRSGETRRSGLVVIGQRGLDRQAIMAALTQAFSESAKS